MYINVKQINSGLYIRYISQKQFKVNTWVSVPDIPSSIQKASDNILAIYQVYVIMFKIADTLGRSCTDVHTRYSNRIFHAVILLPRIAGDYSFVLMYFQ